VRRPYAIAAAAALSLALSLGAGAADAQTRLTLKSAAAGSSYYTMMVQLSEVLRDATGGGLSATVEESQGSVQNVREAPRRPGAFVFTSPPSLVANAQAGREPFNDGAAYGDIRTLFVMPSVTMHFVVRADSGIQRLEDLAGKRFVEGGRGTFTQRMTAGMLAELGIADRVETSDVELNAAVNAMRNRQVDGFATGSSHPTTYVQELSATMQIRILSLTPEQVALAQRVNAGTAPVTIAAGTYPNQAEPVQTVGIPVGAYTTTAMDEQTAYEITRTFWEKREEMARTNPWWGGVSLDDVAKIGVTLHPGAARYYRERGVEIPQGML